jgi:excisionase family DNA binding protein
MTDRLASENIRIDRYFFLGYKVSVMTLITTADAAKKLGVHQTRVQVLIRAGRLPAQMIGGTYVINEPDLALVADRKPGRPPKPKPETTAEQGAVNGAAQTEAQPRKRAAKKKGK